MLTGEAVEALSKKIEPLLRGQDPGLVGAVLAGLLAKLVAGHIVPDDPETTDAYQKETLDGLVNLVRDLIPLEAEVTRERLKKMLAEAEVKH